VQHDQLLSAAWTEHKHNGAVVQLSYSPECTWLATASADGTAHVVRCSSSGSGGSSTTTLVGHKGPLRCANWSHDATLLVTTAADKTVRLWSPVQPAALLQLEPLGGQHQSSRPGAAVGSSRRALGGAGSSLAGSGSGRANSEVAWAQFAYMDELLLVAAGNQLQAYRWGQQLVPVCRRGRLSMLPVHGY
jgi:WD40 repeat protein